MNKTFSLYLDLFRFIAAVMVFISHIPGFTGGFLWQLAGLGHEAVVFFFVLSGFVIAFVCFDKQESGLNYTVNRMARIYSVAIPSIVLTVGLYYLGHLLNPSAFKNVDPLLINPFLTIISALTFTNQSWISIKFFSNAPYWSMGYEVLYYAFFGVLFYFKGIYRYLFLALLLAIMGPSIILYLPVWLLGVLSFLAVKRISWPNFIYWFLYLASIVSIIFFIQIQEDINSFFQHIFNEKLYTYLLEPAEKFASDYFLAASVAIHIFASAKVLTQDTFFNDTVAKGIRYLSAHTFSLYLYHMPIMYFIYAIAPIINSPNLIIMSYCIITPLFILLLSTYTENNKQDYKAFFSRLLSKSTSPP